MTKWHRGSDDEDPIAAEAPSEEATEAVGARHRVPVPVRRMRGRAMAAGVACVLVTAGLGWVTAVAVGLTGPSAEPVVDALPVMAPQTEAPGPTFGRTLDIDGAHANRAGRSSTATPRPTERPTSSAASTSAPGPRPAPERTSTQTVDAVPTVRQGEPCRDRGAAAVTRSGSAAVCTRTPGNGELRWRRA